MMHLARQMPAWVITHLPVSQARQYASDIAPVAASTATSFKSDRQLLVDVSVIYQNDARTGIQRVVRALLLQLLQAPPAGYRVCPVFATRRHGYRYAAPAFLEQPAQALDAAAQPVQVQSGDLFLALDLAAHLLPRHQAQVLGWKRCGVQLHVLVYDLLPLLHPEWFNPKTTRNFERWIRWIAVYADSAICISETVKVELCTWLSARFGLPPTALPASTIVLGADIDASAPSSGLPANAETLLTHLRNTPTVLMVGTLEPRKGHDQALAAFEQLWQQSGSTPLLVLVGRAGWKTEALQEKLRSHPEAGQRLFWLENVSDEYLTCIYTACRGVLVASRAEGFGLPLIEAAMHDRPVLARDLPVFREMKVPAVTYFGSDTPKGLADALINWLRLPGLLSLVASTNASELHFPTWQLSACQLLQALGLQREFESEQRSTATASENPNAIKLTSSPFRSVA